MSHFALTRRALTWACISMALTACAANVVKEGSAPHVPASASKAVALSLSGPAPVTSSEDWMEFQASWEAAMKTAAEEAGMTFLGSEAKAKSTGKPGTLLSVYVNDYRIVSHMTRAAAGAFAGKEYINAKVRFKDLRNGQSYGEQTMNTSAAGLVFSANNEKQVGAIAQELIKQVQSGEAH